MEDRKIIEGIQMKNPAFNSVIIAIKHILF